ncbi:hypothetical protein ElyMa_004388300 [Elysia marginata]|uniref:Uncharacterized protein n=1 Tax=Elysia marginata TaxID=1093978 RepID=A0AAV4H8I9_9GAST|nr:hypothetical protein ElyMa_004388300 [Elysia marginata]
MGHRTLVYDIDEKFHTKKVKEGAESEMLVESSLSVTSIDNDSTEPSFDHAQHTYGVELPSASNRHDMSVSTEGNYVDDPLARENFNTGPAPEKQNIMEEVLMHLRQLSDQMTLQRDAVAQVSDRLFVLEKKVDRVLEKF